jgi:protein-S-isoprenylcysteine O-methyltransferase Ste14
MRNILAFKIVQLVILCIFVVFISDFRRKSNMVPLIGEKWTRLLRASYLVPLIAYMQVLLNAKWIGVNDFLALGITALGTALVVKAKLDLAEYHTGAGYRMEANTFITCGIYAYMRHPLYTGIFVVVIGSLGTILPHLNLSLYLTLPAAALLSILYVMGFLGFLARRETKALIETYGVQFRRYRKTTHPFLPLRKYRP